MLDGMLVQDPDVTDAATWHLMESYGVQSQRLRGNHPRRNDKRTFFTSEAHDQARAVEFGRNLPGST